MCEITINQTGSVQDLTKAVIATNPATKMKSLNPNSVLLIDEVDAFFGGIFMEIHTIQPPWFQMLLNFIYSNRTIVKMDSVMQTQHYASLVTLFPQLKPFNHEIRKMLKNVKKFEDT